MESVEERNRKREARERKGCLGVVRPSLELKGRLGRGVNEEVKFKIIKYFIRKQNESFF